MKAVALQSTFDNATARRQHKAVSLPVPVSPWFIRPTSALDGPVIQRKATCACGGDCPRCAEESLDPNIQTKLAISAPGDQYEREADRVAEQIMGMPASAVAGSGSMSEGTAGNLQRKCACGGGSAGAAGCDDCSEKLDPLIQRREAPSNHEATCSAIQEAPSAVQDVLGAPASPLDSATRAFMEPRFGNDFSAVRIHTDAKAAESAQSVQALAYTVGSNIVFGKGQYSPHTDSGRRLLAHELTHVIQQSSSGGLARAADNRTLLQRACGPAEIRAVAGCTGRSETPVGKRFLFRARCDELLPGELTRLTDFSRTISNGDRLIIHGCASEEGDAQFNENLSCQRARIAQASLADVLALRDLAVSFSLIKHGGITGSRPQNRSVVIDRIPAESPAPRRDAGPDEDMVAASACARTSDCPREFCLPFPTRAEAETDRAANRNQILSSVGLVVLDGGATEVRSLFGEFLDGGRPLQDLSVRLASFFTRSSATGRSIRFLNQALEAYFRANPPAAGGTTVNIRDAIPSAIAALGTPGNPNVMAFRDFTETAGVLAGGVGVGQVACAVGAIPSGVEDRRTASGTATGTNLNGRLEVSSSIEFTVTDTIDFCPGNCGGELAQSLTVPLSRYEATRISGDVPFTVIFSAPIGAFDSEDQ
jgi:hypothetical protein